MKMTKLQKNDPRDAGITAFIPYILLVFCAVLLLIRAFYSFCSSDEPFYFSTAYRFYQGDSIFRHDWFPTQLSGVIILPLFSLYMLLTGSTTGILLFFRICYLIFSLCNALLTYHILKKHKPAFLSFVASVCVLFFAHLNIATLSYYTISVQCFFSAMLLIYHWEKLADGDNKLLIYAGVLYAVSVLALPTMALGYMITMLCFGILLFYAKRMPDTAFSHCIRKARLQTLCKYTFLGILIPAVIFCIFLLTNVSISDLIANIRYVLSDDEHGTSLIYPMKKFFISINEVYGRFSYLGYLLIIVSFVFQKQLSKKPYLYLVFGADTFLFIVYFIKSFGYTGYIQTALCLFALPLFFVTKKKDMTAFFTFFINGMVFSLVYSYSSNGYLYVLSMGHFIASIAGMIFVWDFGKTLPDQITGDRTNNGNLLRLQKALSVVCIVILCIVALQTAVLRFINVYRDAPLTALTERIDVGPAKGLYTTMEHFKQYQEAYAVLTEYGKNASSEDMIFISKLLPWGYLCTDLRVGAPTTWRTELGSERLKEYYALNPERIPSLVLVLDKEYGCYDTCGDVEADPIPNLNEHTEGFLLDHMTKNNYEVIPVSCGVIYRSPSF